jgi:hypothetical protein
MLKKIIEVLKTLGGAVLILFGVVLAGVSLLI